jgi:hypothetical protein
VATDPDSIQREIDETREQLAHTIDAIADRVSPKRAAARSADKVKTRVGSVGKSLHRRAANGDPAAGALDGNAGPADGVDGALPPPAGGMAGSVDRGFGDVAVPSEEWLGKPVVTAYEPEPPAFPVRPAVLGGVAAAIALLTWLIVRRRRH